MPDNLVEYTRSQLALRNGQDMNEKWIAYKGVIYNVTDSRYWKRGMHYEHWAGQDLTAEFNDAPHTERVFGGLQIIGKLKN